MPLAGTAKSAPCGMPLEGCWTACSPPRKYHSLGIAAGCCPRAAQMRLLWAQSIIPQRVHERPRETRLTPWPQNGPGCRSDDVHNARATASPAPRLAPTTCRWRDGFPGDAPRSAPPGKVTVRSASRILVGLESPRGPVGAPRRSRRLSLGGSLPLPAKPRPPGPLASCRPRHGRQSRTVIPSAAGPASGPPPWQVSASLCGTPCRVPAHVAPDGKDPVPGHGPRA
jgi:hypothetical protein